jgi:peroxiredoxin
MKTLYRTLIAGAALSLTLTAMLTAAPQTMRPGDKPESFTLRDPAGKEHSLSSQPKATATVVMFIATQCPISNAYNARMAALAREYAPKGVRFLGINSNKQEAAAEVATHAEKNGFRFPVLKDPNNVVADQWGAQVTPEVFVLDSTGTLVYHGRIDDNQNPSAVTSHDLKDALDAVLAGRAPEKAQTKAFGCTIKRN